MLFKSLIAAAAIAGTALTVASTAEAKTKVDVFLDFGGGYGGGYGDGYSDAGYGYDSGYGYEDDYGHDRPRHHGGWRISCGEGKLQVKYAGFRKVQPIDCDGKTYQYKARKHGDWYVVTVKSKNGNIVDVEALY
jgi:hypothetical protein